MEEELNVEKDYLNAVKEDEFWANTEAKKDTRQQKSEEIWNQVEALVISNNYEAYLPKFKWLIYETDFVKTDDFKRPENQFVLELIDMAFALKDNANRWNAMACLDCKSWLGIDFRIKQKKTILLLYRLITDDILNKSGYGREIQKLHPSKQDGAKEKLLKKIQARHQDDLEFARYLNDERLQMKEMATLLIEFFENEGIFNAQKNKEKTGRATGQNAEYAFLYDLLELAGYFPHNYLKTTNKEKSDIVEGWIERKKFPSKNK